MSHATSDESTEVHAEINMSDELHNAPRLAREEDSGGEEGAVAPLSESAARGRLLQRQKQIRIGKATQGYQRFCLAVPKNARSENDLDTPPTSPATLHLSKRTWDKKLRKWRKFLYQFDGKSEEKTGLPAKTAGGSSGSSSSRSAARASRRPAAGPPGGGGNAEGARASQTLPAHRLLPNEAVFSGVQMIPQPQPVQCLQPGMLPNSLGAAGVYGMQQVLQMPVQAVQPGRVMVPANNQMLLAADGNGGVVVLRTQPYLCPPQVSLAPQFIAMNTHGHIM
eukprot:TRINITY_DN20902_c0_g1_i1.p1 TRINITY_DN20902_c0_g1~~TRINITY_DN20902_c0_g1_i1.p1  ORF type:complete len:280 (+),score=68.01 TRINITY_DN20902_c0_g1_i1:37-876(+)